MARTRDQAFGERTASILTIILIVNGWPQARVRDLLPDRILAEHLELHVDLEPPPALLPAPA